MKEEEMWSEVKRMHEREEWSGGGGRTGRRESKKCRKREEKVMKKKEVTRKRKIQAGRIRCWDDRRMRLIGQKKQKTKNY